MSQEQVVTREQPLSWENLGERTPWSALRETLTDLARAPRGFFRRMAVSGGLYEPIGFLWVLLAALILPSFPLALAYFGLTAPAPEQVSVDVYNYHLLLPRATGIVTALLPLALVAGAAWALLCGTLLYLGSIPFGGSRWEGAVSAWCYSASAGLAPLSLCLGLAALVTAACYLLGGIIPAGPAIARFTTYVLLGLGTVAGLVWFTVALFTGCAEALELRGSRAVAAGLSGLLLSGIALIGWPVAGVLWGARGVGGVAAGLAIVVVFLVSAAGENTS